MNKECFILQKKSVSKNIEYETNNINIKSGELENSNVNSASNIINLISDARLFEMNMKIISNYNEMNQQANKIFNINN
ncbi:hypothetical protein HIC20_01575 [Buchnera aphidicola (Hormaphis cornu)]|nr:hypothetical protein HIC20_01575 [Buchnera aphidicola (Hormaphis cornu)]